MSEKVCIHWLPLVAIDTKWEMEFYAVWDKLDPDRSFSEPHTRGKEVDLCIMAYSASDHKLVINNNSLSQRVADVSDNIQVRLLVLACERTFPKVTKKMLAQLLIDQVPHEIQSQHHEQLIQTSDLEACFREIFGLTLRTKGIWQEYASATSNTTRSATVNEEGSDLWLQ